MSVKDRKTRARLWRLMLTRRMVRLGRRRVGLGRLLRCDLIGRDESDESMVFKDGIVVLTCALRLYHSGFACGLAKTSSSERRLGLIESRCPLQARINASVLSTSASFPMVTWMPLGVGVSD